MADSPFAQAFEEARKIEGPLKDRLAHYAKKSRAINSAFAEAYDRLIARLAAAIEGDTAPKLGEPMPPFVLPGADGRLIALEDILAAGEAIVSFNRGHWCPYCRLELSALGSIADTARQRGATIVSIMPERAVYARRASEVSGNGILVLSDIDNGYALSLGLAIWVGEEVRALMLSRGFDLEEFQGNAAWFLPLPATFVIGQDGIVKARYIDSDFRRRMEIADILAAL
jgi:peroxiredoxin